jgi:hypothetical protein
MAAAKWQFVLTDAQLRPVGELLNVKDRQVSLSLNKVDNLSFKLRLDNPLAEPLLSDLGYIKAYRGKKLVYFGPIVSAEEAGDTSGASVAVTSAGAAWFLQKRLTGTSATGRIFTTVTDRAEIARTLIAEANAGSDTGIATTGIAQSGSLITYTAGPFRTLYDVLTELATGVDAFDWRVLPVENFVDGAVTSGKIGVFVAEPVIGDYQDEAVFEWGAGRNNMKSYSRIMDRSTQANQVFHIASAGPDAPGYPTVLANDLTSVGNYRLLEDIAQADLSSLTLRQQLVNEHVRVRKNPRQIIKFEPHIDPQDTGYLPEFGREYDVGDFVRVRISSAGVVRVDAWLRIWGVTFSIDDNGIERASAILAAQDN